MYHAMMSWQCRSMGWEGEGRQGRAGQGEKQETPFVIANGTDWTPSVQRVRFLPR